MSNEQHFETFAFGDSPEMADELLKPVPAGKKTATVSVYPEDETKPRIGDLSLVLDRRGNPACVIKTVYLQTVPFRDLTWDMVRPEGEDDSFEEWIAGNRSYRTRDAERRGYVFDDVTPISFEIFELTDVL